MYDVIVVGAGPAGNTAANSCSKKGMRTLLIEKYQLPRDKVCSGMIMGPVAHALIKEEFGELPESVLAHPSYLLGYMFHVPGIGNDKLENLTILTWRRNLDHWMNQKAQSSGVEVWHNSHVINIKKETHGFSVVIKFNKEQKEVFTKFVIGADGATSLLRRTLFPKLRVTYSQAYQEHYQWELDIDKSYFHWFYPIECSPAGFAVHQKDGLLIIDAGGRIGQKNQLIGKAKDFLAKNYHFDINQKPIWKGSCLEPIIYRELTSHTFKPAIGNALLVGDAAGLVMPISCEGIGTSMKSGLLAASSIKEAIESDQAADVTYLSGIKGIISIFEEIYPWFRRIIEETRKGGQSLPKILRDSYLNTLRMF